MTEKLRVVSLFSGIGGFEQGIIKALGSENIDVVLSSEIDKYASKGYEALYGHAPSGDITKIHESDIPDHDLLVGGFPCQAFSIAGKRLGFSEARGTLFFEIARILKEKTPPFIILENVKGLINHDGGNTLDTILATLSGLDYTVDFQVLNSKYFNVPQSRERVFFVGIYDPERKYVEPFKVEGTSTVAKAKKRLNEYGDIHSFNFDYPEQNNVVKRLRDILDENVDAKYYLGDDKVAKLIENNRDVSAKDLKKVGFIATNTQGNYVYDSEGVSGTLASGTGGLGGSGGGVYVVGNVYPSNSQCGRVHDVDGLSPTVTANIDANKILEKQELEPKIDIVGNTVPSGHEAGNVHDIDGLSPTVRYNNGKVVQVAEPKIDLRGNIYPSEGQNGNIYADTGLSPTLCDQAPKILKVGNIYNGGQAGNVHDPEGLAPTLDTCQGGNRMPKVLIEKPDWVKGEDEVSRTVAVAGRESFSAKHNWQHIHQGYRIRKLTPKECLRLQGFHEDTYDQLKAAGISDSQIYKQAGNAVTTNVIEALVKRLIKGE